MVVAKMKPLFFITMSVMIFHSCNAGITIKTINFHFFEKINFLWKKSFFLQSHIFCFFLLRLIIVKNIFLLSELMKKNRKNIFFDKNKNIFFIKFLWFYFFRNFVFFMKNLFFEKKNEKMKNLKKNPFFS